MRAIKTICCAFVLAAPLFAATLTEQGVADFKEGRYSAALPKLMEAAKNTNDITARAFLGLTQAAMGNCGTALPLLTATDPGNRYVYKLTGLAAARCYNTSNDDGRAFALLQELETKFPNDADVLYTTAKLHMRAFNDATFAMFQRTPASYRVHELSAEIFETQNRYSDAISEYRKAIDLNPAAPDLHYRLGRALLMQSHSPEALDQAAEQFRAEQKLSPEDAACEFQLAQIAQVQGNTPYATAHFQNALTLSPDFVQALIALGKLRVQEKKYRDGIALLSRATHLQPDNETAHYALLTAYRDSGQMDKAQQEKTTLDRLQKPPEGEFSDFLKRIGEKQPEK
jgi:tetratricopeptide (TPR) repeat protein